MVYTKVGVWHAMQAGARVAQEFTVRGVPYGVYRMGCTAWGVPYGMSVWVYHMGCTA